ncbi:hypothetical protein POX_g09084 [Penicillium oxalicum]|uniref:hypothetical protein n=1 Tax=Penicillium oxalicum TaxID=69781 RepID=UPI0020B64A0B|nr:hypothetical protein POX_g09084 [Penicillium oxalicum]KAI2786696.1 hypothetical protein POX_g09084 [Penicillium oxalicum]
MKLQRINMPPHQPRRRQPPLLPLRLPIQPIPRYPNHHLPLHPEYPSAGKQAQPAAYVSVNNSVASSLALEPESAPFSFRCQVCSGAGSSIPTSIPTAATAASTAVSSDLRAQSGPGVSTSPHERTDSSDISSSAGTYLFGPCPDGFFAGTRPSCEGAHPQSFCSSSLANPRVLALAWCDPYPSTAAVYQQCALRSSQRLAFTSGSVAKTGFGGTPTPQPAPGQTQSHSQRLADPPAEAELPQGSAQPSSDAMDIDSKEPVVASAKKEKGTTTASSSKPPSPKPVRVAKEAPKIPQGSGLITTALFGGVDGSAKSDVRSVPNIVIHVPLNKGNQIINFAQLAEEQYGFAALHPRLAAHKERLARVAAAGAALERSDKSLKGISAGESADEDLSLDVDRDSDLDGDISMIGASTNGGQSEASDGKKKRRRKVEEYDRDDPFVDDSEMAWQEQAAASKDGFFVYSGPLVPEGEKVQVERADGTIKRGRGRGRGTGRGRSLTSQPHVPIAAAVPISQETGLPLRGPGSRGGVSRRGRGSKKTDTSDKHSDRNGTTASTSHESRGGRGGSTAGRGGSSSRGGKNSIMSMLDIAPAPSQQSHMGGIAPAAGASPLAGPELVMK